jgi:Rrf2 family cysteine metabolism transcriptional repressor
MKLTSKGDYATRIVMELSTAEGPRPVSVHDLAARTGISMKYLEQIMLRLRSAQIVRSERGVHGGYALARRPERLTVGEVVRAMDGPLAPSPCASQTAHVPCPAYRCPSEEGCVLRGLWLDVRNAIAGVLDKTTFAELAERQQATAGARGDRYVI